MRVYVHTTNFELSDLYRSHIEERIHYIFRHLNRDVQSVSIRLNKSSEKLDSIETSSKIQVKTNNLPLIYAEKTSDDLYIAIIGSANRAHKNVSRRLNKFNKLLEQLKTFKKQKNSPNTLRLKRSQNQRLQNAA